MARPTPVLERPGPTRPEQRRKAIVIDTKGDQLLGILKQPAPTTMPYAGGATERRGRRSGQVAAKPCPACTAKVAIDPVRIELVAGVGTISCLGCGGPVSVRHSDWYRPSAPVDIADARRRRALRLGNSKNVRRRR